MTAPFATIKVAVEERVGRITLDRPEALNAISSAMIGEIGHALAAFDADDAVGCILLCGSERVFAAGADVKEMQPFTADEARAADLYAGMDRIAARKPIVAAVAGYALGGGCELAMACDIVIAADDARFGQPEITLALIPGLGGTQRLPRLVGKARAMDLILTGRRIDAAEAERIGLVSRVVPADRLMDEAAALARRIAALSTPVVEKAKAAVLHAFEAPLADGLRFERRLFHDVFATADQKEGVAAFLEKRSPRFRNR